MTLPSQAHLGDRVYPIPYLSDEMLAGIQLDDGLVDEWYELVGELTLSLLDFTEEIHRSRLDPADLAPSRVGPPRPLLLLWFFQLVDPHSGTQPLRIHTQQGSRAPFPGDDPIGCLQGFEELLFFGLEDRSGFVLLALIDRRGRRRRRRPAFVQIFIRKHILQVHDVIPAHDHRPLPCTNARGYDRRPAVPGAGRRGHGVGDLGSFPPGEIVKLY